MARLVTPGSTVAVQASRSTSLMRFILVSARSTPFFSGRAPPESPVPAPRVTTGTPCSRQTPSTVRTCSTFSGKATAQGVSRIAVRPSVSKGLTACSPVTRPPGRQTGLETLENAGIRHQKSQT